MIHRYLHDLLTTGIAAIQADPSLLDDIFLGNYLIDTSEAEAIRTYFADHPPNVVNGYARKDTAFPAISIVLGTEQESESFIGRSAGLIADEEDQNYQHDLEAAIWTHSYRLMVFAEHPDVAAYYYEITKTIVLNGLDTLLDLGCFDFSFSGTDLIPDPAYLPAHLYGRQILFGCSHEFQSVDYSSRLLKGFQVSGMHIDKAGAPGEVVGDVNTNIIPVSE